MNCCINSTTTHSSSTPHSSIFVSLHESTMNNCSSFEETLPLSAFKAKPHSHYTLPLDVLPVELQLFILELLDFRSLSRLARSCHRAMAVVQSLPAYHCVMEHGSTALLALSRMDLLTIHSAATLYKALRSKDCSCCTAFAPFLFLPTCERGCYVCLSMEWPLRVLPRTEAQMIFGVSEQDLETRSFRGIPYPFGFSFESRSGDDTANLVTLRQARDVGIRVHGSEEALHKWLISHFAQNSSRDLSYSVRWLTGFTMKSERPQPEPIGEKPSRYNSLTRATTIRFPALSLNSKFKNGL